jgi:ketosteroid isomerase-like protein
MSIDSERREELSTEEAAVLTRVEAFNGAWERRDMEFIEEYYTHDPDMLLFFERRQLQGWERVKALYENMFSHASRGEVESTHSNARVGASGDMAYVASNFRLEVKEPSGRSSVDEGRSTVVFERREGDWVVVHRHTSFQAPPGPQRHIALHTEPGPLWSPTVEGAWGNEAGDILIATGTHMMATGPEGVPKAAMYVVMDEKIFLTPVKEGGPKTTLEIVERGPERLVLRPEGETTQWVWSRLE